MYYIENYYTDEIIDITDDLQKALTIAEELENAIVTDEEDNVMYYCNLDIPFL